MPEMIKVLFVCHGNICRSQMAEAMFRDLVRKKGREEMFFIDSAGTSSEEYGNPMYYAAKEKLRENRIDCGNHRARTMRRDDYEKFDYFIGMDQWNIRNMTRICGGDPKKKIFLMKSFIGENDEISDPWYTRDFERTYQDLKKTLPAFYDYATKNG